MGDRDRRTAGIAADRNRRRRFGIQSRRADSDRKRQRHRLQGPAANVGAHQSRQLRRPADRHRRPSHRRQPVDRTIEPRPRHRFRDPLEYGASRRRRPAQESGHPPGDRHRASWASSWPTSPRACATRSATTAHGGVAVDQVILRLACRQSRHPARRRDPPGRRQDLSTGARRCTTTSERRSRATRIRINVWSQGVKKFVADEAGGAPGRQPVAATPQQPTARSDPATPGSSRAGAPSQSERSREESCNRAAFSRVVVDVRNNSCPSIVYDGRVTHRT